MNNICNYYLLYITVLYKDLYWATQNGPLLGNH